MSNYSYNFSTGVVIIDEHVLGGRVLRKIPVGYQLCGDLGPKKRVILIGHPLTATRRVGGPFGFWRSIIDPGAPLDLDRYCVLAINGFCNIRKSENRFSPGPWTIDQETGLPYGVTFPEFNIVDQAELCAVVLTHLGIKEVYAAMGASGGGKAVLTFAAHCQAFDVRKIIMVAGPGLYTHPYCQGKMREWVRAIEQDPLWCGGDYSSSEQPQQGLLNALTRLAFDSTSFEALEGKSLETSVDESARRLLRTTDARGLRWSAISGMRYDVRGQISNLQGKELLFIPIASDQFFPTKLSVNAKNALEKEGIRAQLYEIQSLGGHEDCVSQIGLAGEAIRQFLA